VLATYKAKQPDELSAPNEAMELLAPLAPEDANDPETVGLAGAIEKRLFDKGQGTGHLDRAIWYYRRGYYLRNDWYNRINLAYLLVVGAKTLMKQQQLEHAQVDFDKAAEIYTGLIRDGGTDPNTGKDLAHV
jgi:MAP3K TRAFs-binding domain